MKTYRNNGAVGALLDEYEKAIEELKQVVSGLTEKELCTIVDSETDDEDCRSIQTILSHVVRAGYTYAILIRKSQNEQLDHKEKEMLDTAADYVAGIDEMFRYNCKVFEAYPTLQIEEYDASEKMLSRWGQRYDVEQLMEHAIVHILRHRRQIERFLLRLATQEAPSS